MEIQYKTERLLLNELSLNDTEFINELVNTHEWVQFIGDRNIRTEEDAKNYVQRIIDSPNINYWVVKLKNDNLRIGIITFIKRDYLEHHDIGFAFLPKYAKNGYAFEATVTVLNDAINNNHEQILATTVTENINSIKLLEKLGLRFEKEMEVGKDLLLIYSIKADNFLINQITKVFFNLFTNIKQSKPELEKINDICFPETIIIKKSKDNEETFNIETFISPRKKILSDGTLTEFEEYEVAEETKVVNNLAQRFSKYQKKGYLNGEYFEGNGNKFFQYIKTTKGWKINAVIWEDENN
ncbi:GNAT family N-acetyltransferase [Chryseobacterium sp. SIMBA_029]|uniref:GNAT family N-acetyltransferase n=1 Tax=Chryseobacterium sp. SIMBA_029 TaxID=3085772 RepID=UPI00397AC8A9